MMILAFAMTTDAVRARRKRVTRRVWTDRHHEQFVKRIGQLVEGWTKSPHRGGVAFCTVRITAVYKEKTCLIPDSDWEDEGFAYMTENGINLERDLSCEKMWRLWRQDQDKVTSVIRFEVVQIYGEVKQVA